MDTASFSVREGVLSYWDLGQETDPDTLRQGLDDLGYRGMSLNHRTYPMALKAALSLVDIPRTIVRKLKRDGQGRDGYAIVREDVKVDENEYDTVATARVDADGQVTVERGWGAVDEYQLRQKTAHFRRPDPNAGWCHGEADRRALLHPGCQTGRLESDCRGRGTLGDRRDGESHLGCPVRVQQRYASGHPTCNHRGSDGGGEGDR
jgi:hypothetical protein